MSAGRRRPAVALTLVCATAAACSGPGGVELGDDWAGSETFVLSQVSGLTTVIGINPVAPHAQALVAVPTRADDDPVLAPGLIRLADGTWLITIHRTAGLPSRLYRIDTKDQTLDVVGEVEEQRTLVNDGRWAAALGGSGPDGAGEGTSLLRYRPNTWQVRDDVELGGASNLASGGPHGVCTAADDGGVTTLSTLRPGASSATRTRLDDPVVQALDCSSSRPVVALLDGSGTGPGGVARLVTQAGVDVVLATQGATVGRVLPVAGGVLAAVSRVEGSELVRLSRATGAITSTVRIDGLTVVDGLVRTDHGYVVTGGDRAAIASLDLSSSTTVELPGQVTAAP